MHQTQNSNSSRMADQWMMALLMGCFFASSQLAQADGMQSNANNKNAAIQAQSKMDATKSTGAHSTIDAKLQVSDAWVRRAPPTARVHAGYARVKNTSKHTIKIVAVSSAQFGAIEMHETAIENGVSKMYRLSEVEIKAGETFEFKPGGPHLMLFRAAANIQTQSVLRFQFKLQDGGVSSVDAVWRD